MHQIMVKVVLFIFTFIILVSAVASPSFAQGDEPGTGQTPGQPNAWGGVCLANESGFADSTVSDPGEYVATIQGLQCVIANILSVAISGIGLAGFVMLIYGSFRYLLSGGNTKGTEAARNAITYAIIGLVVSLSAVIVINLIAAFTGVNALRSFFIPTQIETMLL